MLVGHGDEPARGDDRALLHGAHRRHPGGDRQRLGDALPRADHRSGHARRLGDAVGRDGRHAGGDGRRDAQRDACRSRSRTCPAARRAAWRTARCTRAAGLEVGVASTKTYTASITALYLLACYLGQERGTIDREQMGGLLEPLAKLPNLAGEMMKRERGDRARWPTRTSAARTSSSWAAAFSTRWRWRARSS